MLPEIKVHSFGIDQDLAEVLFVHYQLGWTINTTKVVEEKYVNL